MRYIFLLAFIIAAAYSAKVKDLASVIGVRENQVIGYEFIHLGKMMEMIKNGVDANEAMEKAKGCYGRFADAVKYIDPRKEQEKQL